MIIALQTLAYLRHSLVAALDRALRPYYKRFSLSLPFISSGEESEEEDADDQVFSEFDDEKGVIFFPPMYAQRYAAVSDCLMDERWRGKLEKVADFGYHDMSFIKYLKAVPGVHRILGVDLESVPLKCSSDLFLDDECIQWKDNPLQVTLFQGNAADPDYRLIGCDTVIGIEMIEHMLPHDLDRLVHNVFGFIKPWVVVFTTPNGDFNVLFKALEKNGFRRWDHFFEWSREQFNDWCSNIVVRYPNYTVTCQGIGPGPPGTEHYGCCSQLALFINGDYCKQQDLNINSLALVPEVSCVKSLIDMSVNKDDWNMSELDNTKSLEVITQSTPLNCTTLRVKKFSKTTQDMLSKTKLESLVDTQDVVNKIRHLTKSLNINQCTANTLEHVKTWRNFNWGEDAPYWNQYYKVVKQYNCPFETKSEESKILDAVSDEITRLTDSQSDELSPDNNKLEVPLTYLMNIVRHITDDLDRVRELLEWNGYVILNDVLIHSRVPIEVASVGSCDNLPDIETNPDVITFKT